MKVISKLHPPLCQCCFNPKRRLKFRTGRVTICGQCIKLLNGSYASPGEILRSKASFWRERISKQIAGELAKAESAMTTLHLPTLSMDFFMSTALADARKKGGVLGAVYRTMLGSGDLDQRVSENAQKLYTEAREKQAYQRQHHATKEKARIALIDQLKCELAGIEGAVGKEVQNYQNFLLNHHTAVAPEFIVMRAFNLGLINVERGGSGRPDESDEKYKAVKRAVMIEDGYSCAACGRDDDHLELHTHHIIFLSTNGTNYKENLVTLCVPCHRKQHPGIAIPRNKPIYRRPRSPRAA